MEIPALSFLFVIFINSFFCYGLGHLVATTEAKSKTSHLEWLVKHLENDIAMRQLFSKMDTEYISKLEKIILGR